jgi:hypothetical protein
MSLMDTIYLLLPVPEPLSAQIPAINHVTWREKAYCRRQTYMLENMTPQHTSFDTHLEHPGLQQLYINIQEHTRTLCDP